MKSFFTKNKILATRGVTFLELIIVISIFGVMSSMVLFRYSDFDAGISLTNTVQEIALRVQQAQSDAINGAIPKYVMNSSSQTTDQYPVLDNWRSTYGVYFSVSHVNQFIYFFDRDRVANIDLAGASGLDELNDTNPWSFSCAHPTGADECLDLVTITSGEEIIDVCVDGTVCGQDKAWVLFTRPFPDARICTMNGAIPECTHSSLSVKIKGKGASGLRLLTVTPLGQLSVTTVQ
jgi:prepilin-type N-terminal cleavage/methylation domain-containing protein